MARLQEKANEAFQELNEQFYRFYQFYSNTAVALALSFGAWLLAGAHTKLSPVLLVFAFVAAEVGLSQAHAIPSPTSATRRAL